MKNRFGSEFKVQSSKLVEFLFFLSRRDRRGRRDFFECLITPFLSVLCVLK